mmetsp:Transcript_36755/g.54746  ORF Transcript_36755/g.54746 Transcript_36755/m.54746 type:complete len:221 (-) Transcript_36755:1148-1810(-)
MPRFNFESNETIPYIFQIENHPSTQTSKDPSTSGICMTRQKTLFICWSVAFHIPRPVTIAVPHVAWLPTKTGLNRLTVELSVSLWFRLNRIWWNISSIADNGKHINLSLWNVKTGIVRSRTCIDHGLGIVRHATATIPFVRLDHDTLQTGRIWKRSWCKFRRRITHAHVAKALRQRGVALRTCTDRIGNIANLVLNVLIVGRYMPGFVWQRIVRSVLPLL